MALAIRPQHPSPTAFRPQPLKRDFFSITMDQSSQSRPSLPPISSLFSSMREDANRAQSVSAEEQARRRSAGSPSQESTSPERHSISRSPHHRSQRTPELPPASSFDFKRSEHNSPPLSTSRPSYPSPGADAYSTRKPSYPPVLETSSYPPIPEPNHWSASSRGRTESDPSPQDTNRALAAAESTTPLQNGTSPGLAHQRPLPPFASPQTSTQSLPSIDTQVAPTWQHHHYYPATNPPSYPQTQERYICPTCSKPFSRPSSLKIHTYSHTGEKPYKCKHESCSKSFSVRSNMKRHEKGCHGGDGSQSPRTA